ncbi:MAG: methyltransferase domain-containing protein [Rhizobiales bacterium]|nr:methyltransferase domain-containing protein [Hyphomicrobiales bacterium]
MRVVASISRAILGTAVVFLSLSAALAEDDILFERETPYVPTPQDVVERMLNMANVKAGEYLIDLGSGDGRIVVAAAQRGARAYGVDLDPKRVQEAVANAAKAGVSDRATFAMKDLFDTDISQADVVTTYLLPLVNLDLRPRLLEQMRPGARLVTHAFHMGDDWWPDATDNVRGRVLYTWTIPAKVVGRWQVETEDGNFALDIDQAFQTFKAAVDVERRTLPKVVEAHTTQIREGKLNGTEITFAVDLGVGPRVFRGRVENDVIRGTAPEGWKATRINK